MIITQRFHMPVYFLISNYKTLERSLSRSNIKLIGIQPIDKNETGMVVDTLGMPLKGVRNLIDKAIDSLAVMSNFEQKHTSYENIK